MGIITTDTTATYDNPSPINPSPITLDSPRFKKLCFFAMVVGGGEDRVSMQRAMRKQTQRRCRHFLGWIDYRGRHSALDQSSMFAASFIYSATPSAQATYFRSVIMINFRTILVPNLSEMT